ncbi:hypothetical protein PUMCH_001916 [Australozyma saopauloensis]|uniref:Zn(2)-C6 fungal-type domain-containing protein n=1 Tax=Australozyma saopauloensis TaxID=291208 RepID=A0AAX4H8R8_9ASCO|nr:hypothetical protein PUMCH_001916 [[Candida] saopauloensis]
MPLSASVKEEYLASVSPTNLRSGENIKRRRVTRACDHCRLKKVKCDGKQPCIHCTVYSHNCTYDRPNIRNKKTMAPLPSTPQSAALLQLIALNRMPSISTINENLVLSQNILNLLFPKLQFNFLEESPQEFDYKRLQKIVMHLQARNPACVNLNEISEMYQDSDSLQPSPSTRLEQSMGSETSGDEALGAEFKLILPPKPEALQLIYTTWNKACVLFRFYHRPSLLEEVDLLYSLDPSHYTGRQQKFLPFMYSLLACGSLFSKSSNSTDKTNSTLEDDGFNYFLEARRLIDVTNVADLPSIQTIVMMILYLQCSARLSTCYSYIGIALRSALKEGLHRNLSIFQSKRRLDPIEEDTRKRLFFTIYKMDIYINSLLGLPRSISEDEFDQEFPIELDDELITRDEFLVDKQNGRLSSSACANHHTKLTMILSKIVKELYPIKVKTKPVDGEPAMNIHDKVTELEFELKLWCDNLPAELYPTDPSDSKSNDGIPEKFKLANYYLHFSFLNCKISLYRPFIHYISNGYAGTNSDPRSLIRGRNCIKVARLVVKLANKMIDENLLIGTYWFSMYTIFFSIACLIYYFHFANYNNLKNNTMGVNYAGVYFDDDLNIDMIKADIEIGKKVLNTLKNMSNSSMRIYNILNRLFEQLNRKTAANNSMRSKNHEQYPSSTEGSLMDIGINNLEGLSESNNQVPGALDVDMDKNDMKENKTGDKQFYEFFTNSAALGPEIGKDAYPNQAALMPDLSIANSPNIDVDKLQDLPSSVDNTDRPAQGEGSPADRAINSDMSADKSINNGDPLKQFMHTPLEYVPGVIDAVDAQIYGRILPPYMLEGNIRQAGSTDAHSLESARPELDIDIDGFDLNYLDPADYGSVLESLNPF